MVASTTKDLFGDEEEDQQHLLEDYADEEEEAPRPQAAIAPPAALTVEDRRANLLALVKQKRGATDDASPQDKKKRKRDKDSKKRKGDDAGEVAEGRRPRRDGRPKREARPAQQQQRPARAAGEEQELASDELQESADDQDFIDDEGERPHGSHAWGSGGPIEPRMGTAQPLRRYACSVTGWGSFTRLHTASCTTPHCNSLDRLLCLVCLRNPCCRRRRASLLSSHSISLDAFPLPCRRRAATAAGEEDGPSRGVLPLPP